MLLATQSLLGVRLGLGPAPCSVRGTRLARRQQLTARHSRGALRPVPSAPSAGGASSGSAPLFDEAELQKLVMRLREDDVEYNDLKSLCKQRGIGGRDTKDNLRARLLRKVREELGLAVYGPDNMPPHSVHLPQQMSEDELRHLFETRGCMFPSSQLQALSMANALLIADKLLHPDEAMWPDVGGQWGSLTVQELKQECQARKLSAKGLKDELVERLKEWEAKVAEEAAAHVTHEAAEAEAAAAEGVAPSATNNAQLHSAQELYASMHKKDVATLREELAARGLKAQGTKQVLCARLTEALEKDVALALGGERRLAQWAASAVARMDEGEVRAQLDARGVARYSTPGEAVQALQAVMIKDWVKEALEGTAAAVAGGGDPAAAAAAAGESDWDGQGYVGEGGVEGDGMSLSYGDGYGAGDGGEEAAAVGEQLFLSGHAGDPTLSVALLCSGHTLEQREEALAAARMAAHYLQSDRAHGLLPQQQLVDGAGAERQGIAVQALYVGAGGGCMPLTWEQLHSTSAAELDARLDLQPATASSAAELASAADVVVPMGPSPAAPALTDVLGDRLGGSSGSGAAAALTADRLAFECAAAELGFAAVPAMRLQLAELADVQGAQRLADLAAYMRLEAWAGANLPEGAAPRLAVRAEVAGSVLGGCLVNGTRDAMLGAVALMQEHAVHEVIVEAVQPGAHHFTCSVLQGQQGVAALPPTELGYYDVEQDIGEMELQMERFLAVAEALDMEGVDALLTLLRQEQASHPAYLGGPASPSQQLRQSTPPAHMSAEAVQAVRQSSVKLFQQLGLRDYAQFSGWVLPQRAQQAEQPAEQQAEQQPEGEGEKVGIKEGKSFAELLKIDAEARAETAAVAAASSGSGITSLDRRGATDAVAEVAAAPSGSRFVDAALAEAAGAAAKKAEMVGTYGTYNGILIDDRVRVTSEQAVDALTGLYQSIPMEPQAQPIVEALEDLSATSPQQLCQLGSGHTIAFADVRLVPDLASPSSTVCQQAASVGLTQEGLVRHLVSAALVRTGGQPLPPLLEVTAAEQQRAASAATAVEVEAASDGVESWGLLGKMQAIDHAAVSAMVAEPFEFSTWRPEEGQQGQQQGQQTADQTAAAAGEQQQGGFEFIDATQDPSLDPFTQQQQAAADAGLPLSYDEIQGGGGFDGLNGGANGSPSWGDLQGMGGAGSGGEEEGGVHLDHMHPTRQRVWVLLGGDGPQRTQSLQAGLHAYLSLRSNPELLVEAYLLEPSFAGASEEERRRTLLDRRLDLLKMGFDDEFIRQDNEHFDLARIRHPPPRERELLNHGVWRLSDSGLLRSEVEDLQVACETALATANASLATLEQRGGDIASAQISVARQELELAGVPLDGSAWGGDGVLPEKLAPAQYAWLRDVLASAVDVGATFFLALGDQPCAHGPLQRLLDDKGVPYTGSGHLAAETCADKPSLMEQLLDLEASGISTAPQQKISLPELAGQTESEAFAARLFDQLRGALGAGTGALCLKPALGSNGLGVMRALSGRDLMVYAKAVEAWVDVIPGEALEGGADVVMPLPPPTQFVVEPFVTTEPVQLVRTAEGEAVPPASQTYPGASPEDALASALHWPAGSNQWLQVSAVVLGETGRMRCLGPSVQVLQLQEQPAVPAAGSAAAALPRVQQLALEAEAEEAEEAGEGEQAAGLRAAAEAAGSGDGGGEDGAAPSLTLTGGFELTPPPATLALPEAVRAARVRLEIVADRLGLSGAAEISAYMHAETGELVISDVCTLPDLSPGALIFRQAAASDSPLSPAEVFQELLRVGLLQPMEEREDLQGLAYPEAIGSEGSGAEYDYPADAGYSGWTQYELPVQYEQQQQQ